MNVLIIESIANRPHLETSGEIAMVLKKKKHSVHYAWVGKNLPWTEWEIPLIFKFFGYKIENRVNKFLFLLKNKGIKILNVKDININRYKVIYRWSKNFNGNLKDLYHYKYKNYKLGKGVVSSLISYYKDNNFDPRKNKKKVSNLLFSSAIILERAELLIKNKVYNKIITCNGRFANSYPIVLLAKKFKTKLLRHERGSDFNMYEIYDDDIHDYGYIRRRIKQYWKKKSLNAIKIANSYFTNRVEKKIIGRDIGVSFVKLQKKNFLSIKKNKNEKLLVFYTASDYEYSSFTHDYNQEVAFNKFLKIALKIKNTKIVIRVHPQRHNQNNYEDLKWRKYASEKVLVIDSKDKTDSYELMRIADVIITYSSNIILETAYWGKKSISLGDNMMYSDCKSIITVKNYSKLKKIITSNSFLVGRNKKKYCYPVAYYFQTFGKKFRYYKAQNFYEGYFLGEVLDWKPKIIIILKKLLKSILKLKM